MRKVILGLSVAVTLAGCGGEPTFDVSSEDAIQNSGKVMVDNLDKAKREELTNAMMVHLMATVAKEGCEIGDSVCALKPLDGMTAQEIIDSAKEVQNIGEIVGDQMHRGFESAAQERSANEIAQLRQEREKSDQAKEKLGQLRISNAKFEVREGMYQDTRVISLDFTNTMEKPIAKVYMKGIYQTPARSVPWLADTFNYEVPGGVEPGETVSWNLSPNMMSDWYNQKEIDGAQLRIEVERVVFADGTEIDGSMFDEDDRRRLERLLSES
jgi:hypothetical protein